MHTRQPRYTKVEHARRGREVYERQVRSLVEPGADGRIAAIDVDSGEYEVADNTLSASKQLLARLPDAQIWCVRIGHGGFIASAVELSRRSNAGFLRKTRVPLLYSHAPEVDNPI